MKRTEPSTTSSKSAPPAKRLRKHRSHLDLTDIRPIHEQAKPYHLARAKFPISSLTSKWKVGSNRDLSETHAKYLCGIFENEGIHREVEANYLCIACTQAEVQKMMDHLDTAWTLSGMQEPPSDCLSFVSWPVVNGTKVELMAGQHRVRALELFLQRQKRQSEARFPEEDYSWWICDIYDIGRLKDERS